MGSDHILLVKTAWFREEYKRFYLRDIQAIVVARGPCFYFSMPMLIFSVVWLFSGLFMGTWPRIVAIGWIAGTVAMLVAWSVISVTAGCRCRLYTAVSRDDLPSLFRTWTARRFLRQVQPRIEQVQGAIDPGWIQAERGKAGPAVAAMAPAQAPRNATAAGSTPASGLFLLILVVSAIVGLATANSPEVFWNRVNTGLNLLQLAGAVVVLVQHSRGILGRAIQRVAIASMLLTGVMFYVQTFSFAFINGVRMGAGLGQASAVRPFVVAHQVTYGLDLLLGLIGAIITLRSSYGDDPDMIKD
jgi:hypothetical protein